MKSGIYTGGTDPGGQDSSTANGTGISPDILNSIARAQFHKSAKKKKI